MKTMKLSYLLLILLLSSHSSFSQNTILAFEPGKNDSKQMQAPERTIKDLGSSGIEISYQFFNAGISQLMLDRGEFHFIHIKDLNKMDQVGKPALPCRNDFVALPPGAIAEIQIVEIEYKEYAGYMVHPALEPALDLVGAPEPEFIIDEKTYSSNRFFPEKVVEEAAIQKWRGIPLSLIQIRPVQFNPVTGVIRVYSKIKYRVNFTGKNNGFDELASANSLHFTNMLKRVVLNSNSIPNGIDLPSFHPQQRNLSVRKDYIILAPAEYWMAADSLATWKRQMGYSVDIVLKDNWTTNQIQDSISTRYNAWFPRPDFFVLIGDNEQMPAQLVGTQNNIHSDLYYACMDGVGDFFPDMAKGRISVSSQWRPLMWL